MKTEYIPTIDKRRRPYKEFKRLVQIVTMKGKYPAGMTKSGISREELAKLDDMLFLLGVQSRMDKSSELMYGCLTVETHFRYLANKLDPEEKVVVEEHLKECPSCTEFYRRNKKDKYIKNCELYELVTKDENLKKTSDELFFK